jgi:ferritin
MLNPDLEHALNEQLGNELFSSNLYLSISAWCESANLPGAAHWFRLQADEERAHALRFFDHLVDRGGRVVLGALDGPRTDFGALLEAFEAALEAERTVTASIHRLTAMAVEHGDYAAQAFLQWFVSEQVEEEKQADELVQTLRMIGDQPASLFILDRELGGRQAGAAGA